MLTVIMSCFLNITPKLVCIYFLKKQYTYREDKNLDINV